MTIDEIIDYVNAIDNHDLWVEVRDGIVTNLENLKEAQLVARASIEKHFDLHNYAASRRDFRDVAYQHGRIASYEHILKTIDPTYK